jgi:hypothetical protein
MTRERTSTRACCPRPPERAQLAEDAGDIAEAERLYRVLMNCDPTDAAPPFNLGNLFRRVGVVRCSLESAPQTIDCCF